MDLLQAGYTERPLAKSKIVATVGPASCKAEQLHQLASAGVDLFRLNFAHGAHDWLSDVVSSIRAVSDELNRPIGILGDLAGPKIRLGTLPEESINCAEGAVFEFVRGDLSSGPGELTCSYAGLMDDLSEGDRILLADGTVGMRVIGLDDERQRLKCIVERPGHLYGRQGVNLPGVNINTPTLTEKDHADLNWAIDNELDYIGLSFVRSADDVIQAREIVEARTDRGHPRVVAKIEKLEAVSDIERILDVTDAVMVARGDLGVEVDLPRVPVLQKRIIKLCNQHRIPVITATQMLDSMERNELPTRAEATDVANAVLDGSDAIMLSGETAIGKHPTAAVAMMSRIAHEAERIVAAGDPKVATGDARTRAQVVTEAVTLGAGVAAEHLEADLIVVCTHSGRTAMAISKQRTKVPLLALSDRPSTARRMCLYWGVTPLVTEAVHLPPKELLEFVVTWGRKQDVLTSGSRVVFIAGTNWSAEGHDMMLVHVVP